MNFISGGGAVLCMYIHTPMNSEKDDDDPYRKKITKSPEKKMTIK